MPNKKSTMQIIAYLKACLMNVFTVLLIIHITAGAVALVSGLGASMVKQFSWPHCWHKRFGTSFFWGMLVIFLTAFPMALLHYNPFLLFIAVFSFYFAYTGWRYAKNTTGKPAWQDWFAIVAMTVICLLMVVYGAVILMADDKSGVTLAVLGLVGMVNAVRNGYSFYTGSFAGKKRIALHATMMLAGTIATVTAFVVTNFTMNPEYVLWLAPTALITPYIVYWNIKLRPQKAQG
ncbi:MAG: hypothetical protein ACI9D5_002920 [Candidatus Endobugula sp.]|jgi:hypothetical protein